MLRLSALALLPMLFLGGCLSTDQKQALATGACAGASATYASLKAQGRAGPKTTADFGTVQALCAGDSVGLVVSLAEALKAYNADKALGL